jgi:gluconate 2-dehydrogenase gamma chain
MTDDLPTHDTTGPAGPERPGLMSRRELVALLGATALVAACGQGELPVARSGRAAASADSTRGGEGRFFTPHELATVTLLADLIIPRDARSGSASDAGVPAYIDFALREIEGERARTAIRGGLAWLDAECEERFGKTFVAAAPAERTAVLDDIAWPKKARPELSHGVAFFNDMRDLVATAFWSSRMGVKDLQYQGNVALPQWDGCPEPALRKLGVAYGPEHGGPVGGNLPPAPPFTA